MPIYEKTIKKCINCYNRKFPIACFASSHNIVVGEQNPPSSRAARSSHKKAQSYTEQESKKSIYPILSIDGGGIRGIIPATMLVEIEKITREPIANLFKLMGGTSTGGILTLGLSKPHEDGSGRPQYRAQDLVEVYTQEHGRIFQRRKKPKPPSDLGGLERIFWPLFNSYEYKSPLPFFTEKLGNATPLSSALIDVLITTNTVEEVSKKFMGVGINGGFFGWSFISGLAGRPTPGIFSHDSIPKTIHIYTNKGLKTISYSLTQLERAYTRSNFSRSPESFLFPRPYFINYVHKSDSFMDYVAQVTSAAPLFFPPVQSSNPALKHEVFLDGGCLQNNPAITCVLESLDKGYERNDLFLLSLGTGDAPDPSPSIDFKAASFSMWFNITQPDYRTDYILRDILSPGAYHRLQYSFKNQGPALDDTQPDTIQLLENCGKELVEENKDSIRNICKVLKPDSI
ncbi:patatin-like phospholipase family protein [Neochlamydia sp. AcF65]|uniref:patatin-like phospholipase family protein n=1 Tax=Neochlamydia sp. AcF65 TaxID=2795735 RepID=UPI001BC97A9C|nr:patatin-like phospholipase family protein [Neochlamydia sp. AcF65]